MQWLFGQNPESSWTSTPLDEVNNRFISLGYTGNIGSRQKFHWANEDFYLVEAQLCHDCWGGWRIVLADSQMMPIAELPMLTPSGESESFANPHIRKIDEKFVLSFFMPEENNYGPE